jgi:hypothetical protein
MYIYTLSYIFIAYTGNLPVRKEEFWNTFTEILRTDKTIFGLKFTNQN